MGAPATEKVASALVAGRDEIGVKVVGVWPAGSRTRIPASTTRGGLGRVKDDNAAATASRWGVSRARWLAQLRSAYGFAALRQPPPPSQGKLLL